MDARVLPRTSQVFSLTKAIDNSNYPDRRCMGRCTPIILIVVLSIGCATARVPTPDDVGARVHKQTGQTVRVTAGEADLPAGVTAEDGLTQDEALAAIALWNSPTFLGNLADPGIARAEVAQAGLLRNPVFSLLLPWGPKQLEATLRWPIDALWQRPRRIAAARAAANAVAERLVAGGLMLVTDARSDPAPRRAELTPSQ